MNKAVSIFKHVFIPHEHNDYKPHFFREFSMLSITIVAIVLLSFSAGSILYIKHNNLTATVLPAVLVDLTNDARASSGEQSLARNLVLDQAAAMKAHDMAANGYFAHTSPTGITPWFWFDKAGYLFVYAGENLAINFTESLDVEQAWLNSPTHKANIMNDHFTEIGIATVDGTYQGSPTTYVVQMFGSPAILAAKPTEAPLTVASEPAPEPKPVVTQPTVVKKEVPKKAPSTPVLAEVPTVKGEKTTTENSGLETITDTKDFVAVKNVSAETQSQSGVVPTRYSSWSDRFVFMIPAYTDRIYRVFIWVVTVALFLMVVFEIRRQHAKNIAYGVLFLAIMICLIYINKSMFMTSFLA